VKQRLVGLVMLLAGGLLGYLSVYSPLEAARNHEEKVSLSLKGAMLCPLGVILGLFCLVYGESGDYGSSLATAIRARGAANGVTLSFGPRTVMTEYW